MTYATRKARARCEAAYRAEQLRRNTVAAKVAKSLEDPRPTPYDLAVKMWSAQLAAEIAKTSFFTRVHDDQPDALTHV